ncbi:hypothetical protein KCU78_g2850, partial [Aureobasidium melanogenum]
LANAASSVAANLPGVTAGVGAGVGIGGSVGGSPNPALSSLASSLLSDPAITGAPALSSAIGGLTNPGASVGPALSSALSSILANPSVSLPTGVVSSLVSAISSAANNGGGVASPATNTRASGSSAASSSSTPIACPFASKSTYSVLGSQFTRYCNQFYGGTVLNLGNAVLKRQSGGSLNSCASICAPNARCLGTQYNPSTGACTFYSSLTNGVTRNGIQFAVRSSAASSILPPVSAGVTASASVPAGVPSGALSSLASEASTATGALGSELSSLISQLSTARTINTGALSSLISELPTATSLPTDLISSLVNPASTSRRPSVPGLSAVPSQVSSIVGGLSSAASLGSSALSSLASQITALPTEILPTNVASSLASEVSGISTAVDPSAVLSSIASQITDPASSILSGASSEIASTTSGLLPPGASASAITTSCGGALVDLCATIGLLDGVSVNLGIGGIGGATPTTYSGASGLYTATSTQCSGLVCLAIGLGPSATATLGALQTDGTILDLGAGLGGLLPGVGSSPTITTPPTTASASVSIPDITSLSTSCNDAVCITLGVGPLATLSLGAIGSDGLVGISAGVLATPTSIAGAEITAVSTTCDSLVCLQLGLGPLATVTLGLIGAGGLLGGSIGLGGAATTPAISAPAVAPTSVVVSGNTVTAVSTSCDGAAVDACITLGLGSFGSITLDAGVLPTSGGIASISAGASVGGSGAVITAPAVIPTSTVVNGATITAISQSCGVNGVVDACLSLGLGPLGTITLGADALNPTGGLISAGVSATVLPSLTNGQVVPTSTVINGNTITALSASCTGAAVDACVTLALGNLGTIGLNAGVLPTSGGLANVGATVGVSAGASGTTAAPAVTSPAVLTTISGKPVTSYSTSCGTGSLVNVCATVALGPLGGITVNAGLLGSGGLLGASAGANLLGAREATTLATVVRK